MKDYNKYCVEDLLYIQNKDTLKWGAFNPELEVVVPFEYDECFGSFDNNKKRYVICVKDNMAGFLNSQTKEFLPKQSYNPEEEKYPEISLIKEKDGKFGIVDAYGNFVVQPIYDKIEPWGYQTQEEFFSVRQYKENLYLVELNGKYGIASESKIIKEPVFDDIATGSKYVDRSYSYFEASKDGKYGYVDEHGNTVIDFIYEDVDVPFSLKLTLARTFDDHIHFINLKTKRVVYDVAIENLDNFTIEHNRICILTNSDNKYHLLDADGKILSEFENTKKTDGKRFAYFNDALLESPDDETALLYNLQGKLLEFSEKYRNFTPVSGTTNFVAHKGFAEMDEMLDIDGNVLLSNMDCAYCLGNDEDDLGYPPVYYCTKGDNEEKYTDISITPYKIPDNDSETDTKDFPLSIHEILQDDENGAYINSDNQHYAYIISKKSIRVIDNKGNTTKEIAFNPVEVEDEFYSLDFDDDELNELEEEYSE